MYVIECDKFNYINGSKTKRQIWIIGNKLFYTNKYKSSKENTLSEIKVDELVSILYGARSSTYNYVKKCIPWRCISFITKTSTYDFEIGDFNNILAIIRLFSHYENIKIPLIKHILKFKNWLIKNYKHDINNVNYMYLYNKYTDEMNDKSGVTNYYDIKECPICYEEIHNNEVKLKCNHSYHEHCINCWLIKNDTCPYCRDKIIT